MKKNILISIIVCFIILSKFNYIYASDDKYHAENYVDIEKHREIVQLVAYEPGGAAKDGFNDNGYILVKQGGFENPSGDAGTVLSSAQQMIESYGYNYNSDAQDHHWTDWYSGSNKLKKESIEGMGAASTRRCLLQWTIKSNYRTYIAHIYVVNLYSGSIYIYTNESINEEGKKAKKAEEELEKLENAYKNPPSADASAIEIRNFMMSDSKYNDFKATKAQNKETLKKWRETLQEDLNTLPLEAKKEIGQYRVYIDKLLAGEDTSETAGKIKGQADKKEKEYKQKILNADSGGSRVTTTFNDILDDVGSYKPKDIDSTSAGKIETATSMVLTMISNVGIVVAVIILAVLGVKYMLGSVEQKAEYKEGLLPYVIGAAMLFGITSFVKILIAIGNKIG